MHNIIITSCNNYQPEKNLSDDNNELNEQVIFHHFYYHNIAHHLYVLHTICIQSTKGF